MNIPGVNKQRRITFLSKIYAILEPLFLCGGLLRAPGNTEDGLLMVSVPTKAKHKRYAFTELMKGVTPESVQALNHSTAWALEGTAVGRELI